MSRESSVKVQAFPAAPEVDDGPTETFHRTGAMQGMGFQTDAVEVTIRDAVDTHFPLSDPRRKLAEALSKIGQAAAESEASDADYRAQEQQAIASFLGAPEAEEQIAYAVGDGEGEDTDPWEPLSDPGMARWFLENSPIVVNPMCLGHKLFGMVRAGLMTLRRHEGDVHVVRTAEGDTAIEESKARKGFDRDALPQPSPEEIAAIFDSSGGRGRAIGEADREDAKLDAFLENAISHLSEIETAVTLGTAQIGNQIENARGVIEDISESLRTIAKFASYLHDRIVKEEGEEA